MIDRLKIKTHGSKTVYFGVLMQDTIFPVCGSGLSGSGQSRNGFTKYHTTDKDVTCKRCLKKQLT